MSNTSKKKIVSANKKFLDFCTKLLIAINGLYLLGLILLHWGGWSFGIWLSLIVFALLNGYIYNQLRSWAIPSFDDKGEILNPGLPLESEGLVEYHWDVLYLTWATQIVTLYTNWGWLILALAPAYAVYQVFRLFIIPFFQREPEESEEDDSKAKRRREKRQNKIKIVRKQ
eukprot:TRINITY_DN8591_c0_g1_i1.p1 TRINITY_DN8591_c0_g1~~TRINITY_DN8591_c0_g1_i1.p1  ORF type:complete len:171 (-),score=26.38 TRINITY_DN8591_c0_g1_i1:111-623(-)